MSVNGVAMSGLGSASGPGASGSAGTTLSSTKRIGNRGSTRLGLNGTTEVVKRNGKLQHRDLQPQGAALAESTQKMLERERATLLAEKQAVLECVNDKHDDLVREMFHMENFRMMLTYDPLVAKAENTQVFQSFKSKFDLLEHAAPEAGPSRQTRRRLNERRQMFENPSASTPLLSVSPSKRKGKSKPLKTGEILDILSKVDQKRAKGKERGAVMGLGPQVVSEPIDIVMDVPELVGGAPVPNVSAPIVQESVFVSRRPARKHSLTTLPPPTSVGHETAEVDIPPVLLDPIQTIVEASIPTAERGTSRKRRREPSPVPTSLPLAEKPLGPITIHSSDTMKENIVYPLVPPDESISVALTRRSGRLKEPPPTKPLKPPKIKLRPPASNKVIAQPGHLAEVAAQPSPPKSIVRRIKLIVRRPPPLLTNPKQRAPHPKFKSSLGDFLSSYINVDEEDAEPSILTQEAMDEAKIREKVSQFRRDGRFIPGTNVLFGSEPDETEYISPKRDSKDQWDAVIESVVAKGKMKPRKTIARQVTGLIASRVQAHFDNLEAKRVKAKDADERKLRNLAKSTMKLVIAEWKKSVFHIREQQRLEEEAEERRLGHAHLDAILDQSGQLLETQHENLARGDARSRSQSGSIPDFDGDDEDENETDGGDDEDDDEDEEQLDGNDWTPAHVDSGDEVEPEDESSSMLLGGMFVTKPPMTRSATPATEQQEDLNFVGWSQRPNGRRKNADEHYDTSSNMDLDELDSAPPEFSTIRYSPPRPLVGDVDTNVDEGEAAQGSWSEHAESPIYDPGRDEQLFGGSQPASPPATPSELGLGEMEPIADVLDNGELSSTTLNNNSAITIGHPDDVAIVDHETDRPEPVTFGDDVVEKVAEESALREESLQTSRKEQEEAEEHTPEHLKPYAVAPVEWDSNTKVTPPLLLRGILRPYQQSGLEWLASLHVNKLNGILADEMGLGKTIQTIALLAHLACDRGIWGPHLIVVPTSVLLNWEMEFKKFLPGFRILSYHGSTKRRKELRQGWNDKHHFNVCVTSYALASRDAHIFKRKAWYYLILDEAHMIKNFKSQRWNILLMFRSYRRLLLTGTPLQNNLTELWALLQFLMSGANFANLKEFGDWFSNPLERAIEMGNALDDETMQRVSKLHTVLRPYLLRRLKRDVEKELPSKFEHLTLCPLSKRQRFLYDEFMSRAQTQDALGSGVYQKIANILMQLRKVCNHPDLFEVRPIVTSFVARSAIADFEVKELLVRRRLFNEQEDCVSLDVVGLRFIDRQDVSLLTAAETRLLDATFHLPHFSESAGEPPPTDTRTIAGFRKYSAYMQRASVIARWAHIGYLNKIRCSRVPIYSSGCLAIVGGIATPIIPFSHLDTRLTYLENVDRINKTVKSYATRAQEMANLVNNFAFATPPAVVLDLPRIALSGFHDVVQRQSPELDEVLHQASVKRQIAFPEPSLLQYDCGKLQRLATLLREKKAGGHRVLIFTQMTRILDILEIFLNFHGYLYLRLDGATKIEDRQYITERFNADPRVFCFISSSRSGGVGINLTGADTVVFYDSDFNPQMDRQCEDRAHRIGQIRDVHIYRFVSQFTVEEAMLRKANQKRSLDDLVIQKGEFDWRSLFNDESALTKALGECEDTEDQIAAAVALREETSLVGADEDDFCGVDVDTSAGSTTRIGADSGLGQDEDGAEAGCLEDEEAEEGGTVVDYMVSFVENDWEYFGDWRL